MGREKDILFDFFIGGLEMLADTIEYDPTKAFEINARVCPKAERDTIRVIRELQKMDKTSVYDVRQKPEKKAENVCANDIPQSTKHPNESFMDKEEEAIID